jgi:hypothetical protein
VDVRLLQQQRHLRPVAAESIFAHLSRPPVRRRAKGSGRSAGAEGEGGWRRDSGEECAF